MDVGRMQSRLATIAPCPLRLGAYQAHAGTAGVVVHFPVGAIEHLHVGIGEKVRRTVRPVDDGDVPVVAIMRLQVCC